MSSPLAAPAFCFFTVVKDLPVIPLEPPIASWSSRNGAQQARARLIERSAFVRPERPQRASRGTDSIAMGAAFPQQAAAIKAPRAVEFNVGRESRYKRARRNVLYEFIANDSRINCVAGA